MKWVSVLCAGMFSLMVAWTGAEAGEGKSPMVLITTSMGEIKIELDEEKAPITVKNFLQYVTDKHYDGTIFHRVIQKFMIQGGGMDANMKERSTRAPIKNEAGNGLKNVVGAVAMARTGVVDSATAQFFINVKDNDFLNHTDESQRGFGYAVFGRVVAGMDVVQKIEVVPTQRDVPLEPVVIKSATVVK